MYAYCCKELAAATESATAREAFTEWFCLLTADAKPATVFDAEGELVAADVPLCRAWRTVETSVLLAWIVCLI